MLQPFNKLKADYFLQRREIGIINVGGKGVVSVDSKDYELEYKEALYIGRDVRNVVLHPGESPLYYFNSAPAHTFYPTRKVSSSEASVTELGYLETPNHRTIRKLIVHGVVETCQLQMGLTELKPGSVWNTCHHIRMTDEWKYTSILAFIWGMAGENLDYSDMDAVTRLELK